MANSVITKKALASSLKELMREIPFSRITVSMICKKCSMNRKSFYYHFKDKHDLANKILDIEYLDPNNKRESLLVRDRFLNASRYFYNNRDFYRCIIKTKGQDSFYEHFVSLLVPIVAADFEEMFNRPVCKFDVNFYTDAIVCAFVRWLLSPECSAPEEFAESVYQCLSIATEKYMAIAR